MRKSGHPEWLHRKESNFRNRKYDLGKVELVSDSTYRVAVMESRRCIVWCVGPESSFAEYGKATSKVAGSDNRESDKKGRE